MGDDTGYHRVEFEDSRNLDDERRKVRFRTVRCPWSRAYTSNLYLVSPRDEECRVVLPMKGAFKQVRTRAIRRSVDENDSHLRLSVVYFDSLCEWDANFKLRIYERDVRHTHQIIRPSNQPPSPFRHPDWTFSRMQQGLFMT